jgi:ankyrin repeat protein
VRALPDSHPVALDATRAIHAGDVDELIELLGEHPQLARSGIAETGCDNVRSMLHVAVDWPADFPHCGDTLRALIAAGADVDARGEGKIVETPLMWAASGDNVEALDVLLDAGADIEARGAVIAGGTALDDAVAFGQWNAAHRLVERGATPEFRDAAALGLLDRLDEDVDADTLASGFWYACHGGQLEAAQLLHARGAPLDWVSPWDGLTPLDAAARSEAADVVEWLRAQGAVSAPG